MDALTTAQLRATSRLAEALVGLVQETVDGALATALSALAEHDARLGGGVWLSASDVARRLSVSADTARGLLAEQGIYPIRIGSVQRYSAIEVKGWLDGLVSEQAPKQAPITLATPDGVMVIETRRRKKRAG